MARISFDEQVARWLRRSNPGYLGGRSESVGPPLFPQAALETFKMPFAQSGPQACSVYSNGFDVAEDTTGILVDWANDFTLVSPDQTAFSFDFATDPTIVTVEEDGWYLLIGNGYWGAHGGDGNVGVRRIRVVGTSASNPPDCDLNQAPPGWGQTGHSINSSFDSAFASQTHVYQSTTSLTPLCAGATVSMEAYQASNGGTGHLTQSELDLIQLLRV